MFAKYVTLPPQLTLWKVWQRGQNSTEGISFHYICDYVINQELGVFTQSLPGSGHSGRFRVEVVYSLRMTIIKFKIWISLDLVQISS